VKRWIVFFLVVLAVVVLVSPGIVGRMAEKNLEEHIAWAESKSGGIEFLTESFDRGWFTSEGHHRLVLSGGSLREVVESYLQETANDKLPSLIIDTRLDHGLVPIGSLGREFGSLMPVLASTVSTFQIDPGNGELVPLPGSLYSNVSLTGATDSHYLLETGNFQNEELRIEWGGADVALHTNSSAGSFVVEGRIEPVTIYNNGEAIHIGAISISVHQVRSDFGFNVGSAEFILESFVVDRPAAPVTVGHISLSADANVDDARLNISSKIAVDEINVPGMGNMNFVLNMALSRLDAASMQVIAGAVSDAQRSADPEAALADLLPLIEEDLQKIFTSGAEFRIDQLDVTLPQGKVTSRIIIDIPEGDSSADFAWSSVLLATTASADIRMPTALFEFLRMMNPQAGALVAMGILLKDGDDYVMNAEYAQGLLNVNGAPMPIPMPGM